MLSKLIAAFAATLGLFCSATAEGGTIHFLLAADTANMTGNENDLGRGALGNLGLMRGFETRLRATGNYHVIEHVVAGREFSCTKIVKMIADVRPGADDVVIFSYSGHGFRTANTSTKFPDFDCRIAASDPQIGLSGIVAMLQAKATPPRLVMAIADTCNVDISGTSSGRQHILGLVDEAAGFARLLGSFRGTVLMSASQPGEPAYYRSIAPAMGYFTGIVLPAMAAQAERGANAAWDPIKQDLERPLIIQLGQQSYIQHPQVDLQLTELTDLQHI